MLTSKVRIFNSKGVELKPKTFSIIGDSEDDLLIVSMTFNSGNTLYSYLNKMIFEKGILELVLDQESFELNERE